jgi:DNA-binding MarR family transcriptional regulator
MSDLERDIRTFLAQLDALAERVQPKRRPQDAGVRECSPRELRALGAIGQHGRLTMSALAELLEVPLSTATRTVDKLVSKGLIERKQSAQDRRVFEVAFGRRGKRIHQYVLDSRQGEARTMLAALTIRERRDLLAKLAQLVAGGRADPA